jgi:hypothetical protein
MSCCDTGNKMVEKYFILNGRYVEALKRLEETP